MIKHIAEISDNITYINIVSESQEIPAEPQEIPKNIYCVVQNKESQDFKVILKIDYKKEFENLTLEQFRQYANELNLETLSDYRYA